jgi:aerobic carbon-monoxide dehydrogenase large subunit
MATTIPSVDAAGRSQAEKFKPTQKNWVGKAVKRREDARIIRGKGRYLDDIQMEGMVHCKILRSPYAHARIKSVDVSKARAAEGVLFVLTGE